MKNNYCIKKSDFLEILDNVLEDVSIDYLITLRDGLNIIIRSRVVDFEKPFNKYYKGRLNIKI